MQKTTKWLMIDWNVPEVSVPLQKEININIQPVIQRFQIKRFSFELSTSHTLAAFNTREVFMLAFWRIFLERRKSFKGWKKWQQTNAAACFFKRHFYPFISRKWNLSSNWLLSRSRGRSKIKRMYRQEKERRRNQHTTGRESRFLAH